MKNILLVSPDAVNEALWVSGDEAPCVESMNNFVPLGLATVAALTPEGFHVDIWDEIIHGRIDGHTRFARDYDLVGLTGYSAHRERCQQIAEVFRSRGVPVAIGGPGVSSSPDLYRGRFDVLFCGEVELTWPQFLKEWQEGRSKPEYRQIEKPDLGESPIPRWESLLDVFPRYAMGCVQTTRGCPFDCEFCDVIYLFGRRSRHKPIANVLEEVRVLERLGKDTIMLCDDEFIGDPKYAKELLRALIPLNNSFARPLSFSTQLTMNLSRDEELLGLLADANFNLVFIGIESPNRESLQEMGKTQNIRKDLLGDIHKIMSYGIAIRAGIIVGFDHDGPDIFDIQYEFIQKACLQSLAINILKAPHGTKLWTRLRQEGRVVSFAGVKGGMGNPKCNTNILPKGMSRVELMRGYRELQLRVHSWASFGERIRNFVSLVKRLPDVREEPLTADEAIRVCLARGVDAEGAAEIEKTLRYTEEVCPRMVRRVKIIIVQFMSYLESVCEMIPALDRQIAREQTPEFSFEQDRRPLTVPAPFRAAFEKMFERVYGRVYVNLTDRGLAAEALTEVFTDFLVAWGKDFDRLEEYHIGYLNEICDRTCARLNGQQPQDFVPVEVGDTPLPNVKRTRLADDILKGVEYEMARVGQGQMAATP